MTLLDAKVEHWLREFGGHEYAHAFLAVCILFLLLLLLNSLMQYPPHMLNFDSFTPLPFLHSSHPPFKILLGQDRLGGIEASK